MSRKRTPDQSSSTEPEPPAEPTAATAALEPPAPETTAPTQSFVERIEQERRKGPSAPDPFGIAGDYEAGVRLFENRQDRLMAIKFDEKPSLAVIDTLKDAGFRWNPRDKVWVHPIRAEFARTTRIEAERLYQEVRSMIRQEKGLGASQEIPF